jgi:hypothetical protein
MSDIADIEIDVDAHLCQFVSDWKIGMLVIGPRMSRTIGLCYIGFETQTIDHRILEQNKNYRLPSSGIVCHHLTTIRILLLTSNFLFIFLLRYFFPDFYFLQGSYS